MGDALITRRGGSGGGSATIQALSVTANGTYTASGGVDGYSPVTVNVSGGGLSNSDAILSVTVQAGASVTATKGGATSTPIMWTQDADGLFDVAIFSIPSTTFDSNSWTITATINGKTLTDTVVINQAKAYELNLYDLYFVQSGVLTNQAWVIAQGSSTSANITQNSGYVAFATGGNVAVAFSSSVPYDLTDFSTLKLTISAGQSYYSSNRVACLAVGISRPTGTGTSTSITGLDFLTKLNNSTGKITAGTYLLDVSALSGTYFVGLTAAGSSSLSGTEGRLYVTELVLLR